MAIVHFFLLYGVPSEAGRQLGRTTTQSLSSIARSELSAKASLCQRYASIEGQAPLSEVMAAVARLCWEFLAN